VSAGARADPGGPPRERPGRPAGVDIIHLLCPAAPPYPGKTFFVLPGGAFHKAALWDAQAKAATPDRLHGDGPRPSPEPCAFSGDTFGGRAGRGTEEFNRPCREGTEEFNRPCRPARPTAFTQAERRPGREAATAARSRRHPRRARRGGRQARAERGGGRGGLTDRGEQADRPNRGTSPAPGRGPLLNVTGNDGLDGAQVGALKQHVRPHGLGVPGVLRLGVHDDGVTSD